MGKAQFNIEDVLSVYMGILLGEIGGVYKVLSHLHGESLYTHMLPRARELALPSMEAQLPWLTSERFKKESALYSSLNSTDRKSTLDGFVTDMTAAFGLTHELATIEESK